ncbi:MAG: hypothetical protein QOF39_3434 [Frankiales bacterium]|nr:hypothetical protein [Frankiales bacterium]
MRERQALDAVERVRRRTQGRGWPITATFAKFAVTAG